MQITLYKTNILPGDVDIMTFEALTTYLAGCQNTVVNIPERAIYDTMDLDLKLGIGARTEGFNYATILCNDIRYCYYVSARADNVLPEGVPVYSHEETYLPLTFTLDWRHTAPILFGWDTVTGNSFLSRSHLIDNATQGACYQAPHGVRLSTPRGLTDNEGFYVLIRGQVTAPGETNGRTVALVYKADAGDPALSFWQAQEVLRWYAGGIRSVVIGDKDHNWTAAYNVNVIEAQYFYDADRFASLPEVDVVFESLSIRQKFKIGAPYERRVVTEVSAVNGAKFGNASQWIDLAPRPYPYKVTVMTHFDGLSHVLSLTTYIDSDCYQYSGSLAVSVSSVDINALSQQRTADAVGVASNIGSVIAAGAAIAAAPTTGGLSLALGGLSIANAIGGVVSNVNQINHRTTPMNTTNGEFVRDILAPSSNGSIPATLFVWPYNEYAPLTYERDYYGATGLAPFMPDDILSIPSDMWRVWLQGNIEVKARPVFAGYAQSQRVRAFFNLRLDAWRAALLEGVRVYTDGTRFKQ